MIDFCRGGDVAPRTFAALDEWDKIQLDARLDRTRRERLQRTAAETTLTATEIEAHSKSDEIYAEGEQ